MTRRGKLSSLNSYPRPRSLLPHVRHATIVQLTYAATPKRSPMLLSLAVQITRSQHAKKTPTTAQLVKPNRTERLCFVGLHTYPNAILLYTI